MGPAEDPRLTAEIEARMMRARTGSAAVNATRIGEPAAAA